MFYWGKTYTSILKEGQDYEYLAPVISINLLDLVLWPQSEQVHSCFMLKEIRETDRVFSSDIVVHCLEVPKWKNQQQNLSKELNGWLTWLNLEGKIPEKELLDKIKEDTVMCEVHNTYNRFLSNDELMEAYEGRQKWLHEQASLRKYAMQKGMQEGLEKGKRDIARTMLAEGIDVEAIVRITGLSRETIFD